MLLRPNMTFFEGTVAVLNIELQCNIYCLVSLSLRFWRVPYLGVMN
jgi:hypothetical protein